MASRAMATTAFLLMFNLVFFTLVTSTHTPKGCPPPPKPKQTPPPKPPTPSPKPPTTPPPKPPTPSPKPPTTPPPKPPTPSPKPPTTPPPKPPTPSPKPPTPACPPPPKTPAPAPSKPPPKDTCPIDTLKLGVCATLLQDLLPIVIGTPPKTPCCSLLEGLVDLEAAVCLCTAIKANILGINLNVPISLSVLLNYCGKKVPSGFQCA